MYVSKTNFNFETDLVTPPYVLKTKQEFEFTHVTVFSNGKKLISIEHQNVLSVQLCYFTSNIPYLCVFHTNSKSSCAANESRFLKFSSCQRLVKNIELRCTSYRLLTADSFSISIGYLIEPHIYNFRNALLITSQQSNEISNEPLITVLFMEKPFTISKLDNTLNVRSLTVITSKFLPKIHSWVLVIYDKVSTMAYFALIKKSGSHLMLQPLKRLSDFTVNSHGNLEGTFLSSLTVDEEFVAIFEKEKHQLYVIKLKILSGTADIFCMFHNIIGLPVELLTIIPTNLRNIVGTPITIIENEQSVRIYSSVHEMKNDMLTKLTLTTSNNRKINSEVIYNDIYGHILFANGCTMKLFTEQTFFEDTSLEKYIIEIIFNLFKNDVFIKYFIKRLLLSYFKQNKRINVFQELSECIEKACNWNLDETEKDFIFSESEITTMFLGLHMLNESLLIDRHFSFSAKYLINTILIPFSKNLHLENYYYYYCALLGKSSKSFSESNFDYNSLRSKRKVDWSDVYYKFDNVKFFISSELPPKIFDYILDVCYKILHPQSNSSKLMYIYRWPKIKSSLKSGILVSLPFPIALCEDILCLYSDCAEHMLLYPETKWWERLAELYSERIFCSATYSTSSEHFYRIQCLRSVTERLTLGALFMLLKALTICRQIPAPSWDISMLETIGRYDLAASYGSYITYTALSRSYLQTLERNIVSQHIHRNVSDSCVSVNTNSYHFWGESRLGSAQEILDTSVPIKLNFSNDNAGIRPEYLNALRLRTCALPLGRGMLMLATQNSKLHDTIPIPPFVLDFITRDGVGYLGKIDSSCQNIVSRAQFHNECAAGLRYLAEISSFSMGGKVKYELKDREIGFNFGLHFAAGLRGHLRSLTKEELYNMYTSELKEYPDSIPSFLIALGVSFRGTNDEMAFSIAKTCAPSLNPTLNSKHPIDEQAASLISVGLISQGSFDRYLASVLLSDISRRSSDEFCEGQGLYTMGAGVALGLLCLEVENTDFLQSITDRLFSFINGNQRNDEREKSYCRRINCQTVEENGFYNKAISGPAAVMALSIIGVRSGDMYLAQNTHPGQTLEEICANSADLCLQRTFAANIISWHNIIPFENWLYGPQCIPPCLLNVVQETLSEFCPKAVLDYYKVCFVHIISGAILALGVRFVGTRDEDAKKIVTDALCQLSKKHLIISKNIFGEHFDLELPVFQEGIFYSCIGSCAIALGLIMCGSCDSACMSLLMDLCNEIVCSYNYYMAIAMAIGFLCLGCGRLSISYKRDALAYIIISVFPFWPNYPKMHLEHLRHLYVLAAVPRMLFVRDMLTDMPVNAIMRLLLPSSLDIHNANSDTIRSITVRTPCLVPPLHSIEYIEVLSAEHCPLVIKVSSIEDGDNGLPLGILSFDEDAPTPWKSERHSFNNIIYAESFCSFDEECIRQLKVLLSASGNVQAVIAFNLRNISFLAWNLDVFCNNEKLSSLRESIISRKTAETIRISTIQLYEDVFSLIVSGEYFQGKEESAGKVNNVLLLFKLNDIGLFTQIHKLQMERGNPDYQSKVRKMFFTLVADRKLPSRVVRRILKLVNSNLL